MVKGFLEAISIPRFTQAQNTYHKPCTSLNYLGNNLQKVCVLTSSLSVALSKRS
jgi:hypothetical protein